MNTFQEFFSNGTYVLITLKIALGVITSFLAILAWQKARRMSSLFFIIGVLTLYTQIIYNALISFGIINIYETALYGIKIGSIVTELIPLTAFMISLILFLIENKG